MANTISWSPDEAIPEFYTDPHIMRGHVGAWDMPVGGKTVLVPIVQMKIVMRARRTRQSRTVIIETQLFMRRKYNFLPTSILTQS